MTFSSPLWGFFYLILITELVTANDKTFSSPLWGFFYLIIISKLLRVQKETVLVPSLGILLFNYNQFKGKEK